MMRVYALLTDQGTAALETALCTSHYRNPRCRARAVAVASTDVVASPDSSIPNVLVEPWSDCTDNDALVCRECGEG
jgi:hypothetical protein